MSDDKITISWDELDSGESSAASTASPHRQPPSSDSQSSSSDTVGSSAKKDNTPIVVAGIIGAIAVLFILLMICSSSRSQHPQRRQTVDEWSSQAIAAFNAELAKPDSPIRQRIEAAHLTVNVIDAEVLSLKASTRDGSDYADDGENIETFTIRIKFTWDGVLQKDGYTVLEMAYDMDNGKLVKSDIIDTNAAFNTEDPSFWFDVGWGIGTLLAL